MPVKKSIGRKWGISPRPAAEDLPEWTRDFHGPGWAATPNPQASASKQQRKAWLLLGCILAALPVSLLSCVIAMSSGSQAPVQLEAAEPAEWSLARSEAHLEAQRWLRSGGIEPSALAWRESQDSLLPCSGGAKCEEHTFTALLADGVRVLVVVTVDPTSGDIAGVHMHEEPRVPEPDVQQQDDRESDERPVWADSRDEAVNTDVSLEDIRSRIHEWASAWAARDLRTLAELAGVAPGIEQSPNGGSASVRPESRFDGFVLGAGWWVVHPPESVEVLSLVEGPSPLMQLATAAFSLARECTDGAAEDESGPQPPRCSECSTRSSAGPRLCDGSLDMTADLWIEASRTPVQVRGSAHVGGLDPQAGPAAVARTQNDSADG